MRLSLVLIIIICSAFTLTGQTNPDPYDLSQGEYVFTTWNASQPAGTYPPNMRFHRGGGQDPGLTAEPTADYTGVYNSTSGNRMNGLGDNGFSWRNIGTGGDLGAAVLALNTTGLSNILVSWTGGTVDVPEREYRIRLQYRVGTSGTWTDVPGPVEYITSTVGHSQNFGPTLLPSEVNDKPVVQVRWKYYYVAGSGNRPQLRVGNIKVQSTDEPGNGTGAATIVQSLLRGGASYDLDFTVSGTHDDITLTNLDIVLPEIINTDGLSAEDITLSDTNGSVIIDNHTIKITNVSITKESELNITVTQAPIPDLTGMFTFEVRTGAGSDATVGIASYPELLIWGTPIKIEQASENDENGVSLHLGKWITIRGVVTVADQFETGSGAVGTGSKGPSYIQDETGGFAVFAPSGVTAQVEIGDEVTLLGKVTQFFGLNQLDESTMIVDHHGSGNVVQPAVVTLSQLKNDGTQGLEIFEGRLVRINGITVNTNFWHVDPPGTNYELDDGTVKFDVRINKAVNFAGAPAPTGPFDIVGVVSQFRPDEPLIGGYQLMPRFSDDIIFASEAPMIVTIPPYESSATASSITFYWETDGLGTSEVRYGLTTDYELGKVIEQALQEQHTLTVSGLEPATIYNFQIRSAAGQDTTVLSNYIAVTTSPSSTTGRINVYFNKSVDPTVAVHDTADGDKNFLNHLWGRILSANHSIDIALYSLSGNVGSTIAEQLINAKNRGVQVRVIMEDETSNTAPPTALKNAGIPFITDTFGSNDGTALHHNKFAVFDYYGGDPDEVWVITGSWNPTDPGTNTHHQNIIEFQDVALAAAYTREFEQMWGSSTTVPDETQSRFGENKTVTAPSVFWIGDTYVRLFFSPQGGPLTTTEEEIIRALVSAQHTINLGLNLITRSTIVNAMKNRFDEGIKVRGVVGETTTTGSVFSELASWADVHEFSQSTFGLLHHKYAIVDGENMSLPGKVITGSHNWSRAANERNDENTLIIHSPNIANLYLQEFVARYKQAGGEDEIVVSVERTDHTLPDNFVLYQNYPNPFNPFTTIQYSIPFDADVSLTVYNILGQQVAALVDSRQSAGTYTVTFDATQLPSGVYMYRLRTSDDFPGNGTPRPFDRIKRMVLVK